MLETVYRKTNGSHTSKEYFCTKLLSIPCSSFIPGFPFLLRLIRLPRVFSREGGEGGGIGTEVMQIMQTCTVLHGEAHNRFSTMMLYN
jgi:hypothetical protein